MAGFESEKGPWVALIRESGVTVESQDFTHDVTLDVNGDFATIFDKHAYGCAIAAALNKAMPLKPVS